MPEDDDRALGSSLIPEAKLMIEALALHCPLYPRAPGRARSWAKQSLPNRVLPDDEEDTRPFAGLAGAAQGRKLDKPMTGRPSHVTPENPRLILRGDTRYAYFRGSSSFRVGHDVGPLPKRTSRQTGRSN